jgi:ATP citrate (pro-S)-lyase
LFKFYADLNFTYLEINPIVVTKDTVIPLDLAAKLDSTAEFESGNKLGKIEFPAPFGRTLTKEKLHRGTGLADRGFSQAHHPQP